MNGSKKENPKAFILISTDPSMIKKTSEHLLTLDRVQNIHELYGQFDIIIKVITENRSDLDDFSEDSIRHLPGIRRTETLIVSDISSKMKI